MTIQTGDYSLLIQPARHECHACCLLRAGFLAFQPVDSGQHAWHSCRAGCIVISENTQRLATQMVYSVQGVKTCSFVDKYMGSFLAPHPTQLSQPRNKLARQKGEFPRRG